MGTIVLLDLMGGVALLLWGLHMVQSGILRAFGPELRRLLSKALQNRLAAFSAGLGLTALLQSSTATGLMAASFVSEGVVALVPALAIMLPADFSTPSTTDAAIQDRMHEGCRSGPCAGPRAAAPLPQSNPQGRSFPLLLHAIRENNGRILGSSFRQSKISRGESPTIGTSVDMLLAARNVRFRGQSGRSTHSR